MDTYMAALAVILPPLLPERGMTREQRLAYAESLPSRLRAELSFAEMRGMVEGDLYGDRDAGWTLTRGGERTARELLADLAA